MPRPDAERVAALPPVGLLFAAFLGVNPIAELLGGPLLERLAPAEAGALTGETFFPDLIASPFRTGLRLVFSVSIVLCILGAIASLLRPRHRGTAPSTAGPAATDATRLSLASRARARARWDRGSRRRVRRGGG